jgi:membrane protein DedA with SNARE-associated domain
MRQLHNFTGLLDHYGYIVLVVALMLELIAFPLPGEVLMTYCGVLVSEYKLNWVLSILMATVGAVIGVTLSYLIGKTFGTKFFKKYGHYVHLDEKKLNHVSEWFDKFGNRLLLITYFIPGVRHITGYFSGITQISYKEFAFNSYLGAFIWTTTFISIGKILGPKWEKYHSLITKYLLVVSLIIAVVLVIVYVYKNNKFVIGQKTVYLLERGLKIFHSFGRIKVFILGITVAFLTFLVLVMGIIQDLLAHEFSQFDEVAKYLVIRIFNKDWNLIMNLFKNMASLEVLTFITIISAVMILIKGINKLHEIKFMVFTTIGAGLLDFILRLAFHRIGPLGSSINGSNKYTFPSYESLMAIVVFGFLSFVITRHSKKNWIKSISIFTSIIICLFIGLSMIYFGYQYPSDIIAGYEIGGLWITLNLILLEVYRILPTVDFNK